MYESHDVPKTKLVPRNLARGDTITYCFLKCSFDIKYMLLNKASVF